MGAAAIGGIASLASGAIGASAADRAAQTQASAADQSLAYQKETDAKNLALSMPWIEAGRKALAQYQGEIGLTTTNPDGTPFKSAFTTTPGYDFQVSEGEKGVTNNLAALGMKNSGAALKALTRFRQGLADTTRENYLTRLSNAATGGQQQVATTTNALQNSAINQGQTIQDAAAARASGYVGGANSWINALTNISNTGSNALGWLSGSNKLKNVYA